MQSFLSDVCKRANKKYKVRELYNKISKKEKKETEAHHSLNGIVMNLSRAYMQQHDKTRLQLLTENFCPAPSHVQGSYAKISKVTNW